MSVHISDAKSMWLKMAQRPTGAIKFNKGRRHRI